MFERLAASVGLAALVILGGCADTPKPKAVEKAAEAPPKAVTGRVAFYQMYGMARQWAPDLQPLRLRSIRLPQVPDGPGTSGAWEATFMSASKGKSRTYTWSAIESEGNLHKGVFQGLEERTAMSAGGWIIQAFKIDSDEAYAAAFKKSKTYVEKNPDKPVLYLLEQTKRHPFLAWRVIWGDSVSTSNYSVYVNASTGDYLETMR